METHEFQGRLDRGCDICGNPDRHPCHQTDRANGSNIAVEYGVWISVDDGLPDMMLQANKKHRMSVAVIGYSKEFAYPLVGRFYEQSTL